MEGTRGRDEEVFVDDIFTAVIQREGEAHKLRPIAHVDSPVGSRDPHQLLVRRFVKVLPACIGFHALRVFDLLQSFRAVAAERNRNRRNTRTNDGAMSVS